MAQDFLIFAKVTKFRPIWSHWLPRRKVAKTSSLDFNRICAKNILQKQTWLMNERLIVKT